MSWAGALTRIGALIVLCGFGPALAQDDALSSWNEGPTREGLVAFVEGVIEPGGPDFVPENERIAVFDNDGTLWVEQPLYTQLAFALDRVRALAPEHPEWQTEPPFQAVLEGDMEALAAGGAEVLVELIMASHAGMTTDAFAATVEDWLATATHPRFARRYTELTYQPMQELLDYLRANGFTTFIVSGGGIAFMRPWTEEVYGIPPEQVVGSSIRLAYEVRDGEPVLVRLPEIDFIDDKEGKPVGIQKFIGRRPLIAVGNSDGDRQMLEWTTAGAGPRLGVIIRHDDADREYAYDRESHIGRLDQALDQAEVEDWLVVSMKRDWRTIFQEP